MKPVTISAAGAMLFLFILGITLSGCPMEFTPPDPVAEDDVTLAREHSQAIVPGATTDIVVEIGVGRGVDISAIAVVEELPSGWTYVSASSPEGLLPSIRPSEGAAGTLTFVWIQTPDFPYQFTYTVQSPATGWFDATFSGHVEYRQGSGPSEFTDILSSSIAAAQS
jgi:hypothetical protein